MARVNKPGNVTVDVAANTGVHALGLNGGVGASGRAHALEPEPRMFQRLKRAVMASGMANGRPVQAAAGACAGPANA